ncbi:MAG TPA: phosphoribosylaminoimidazolesuccinocarboxamide synthase [Desulfobacteraceae bacterium]|nr:phosphoribosylaminoimidazolesuccinocarboxamide synthase [Desulfobacteraceae bacterium]
MNNAVFETDFQDLNLLKRGKVRDIYDLGDCLLMVVTDRISAFDLIMPEPVCGKGKILTEISLLWFRMMESIVKNHLITSNVDDYPVVCAPYKNILKGRSMLVKKARPFPIECVVRGYISGSGWNSYVESGSICGIKLPKGLKESERLPETIFTPSTKEEVGTHDININFADASEIIGETSADRLKELSLKIYKKAVKIADTKGIIIADTKFEFGLVDDEIILIDEILTPDSSRFWPKKTYMPGGPQVSFDKQYIRDYLLSINWDKNPPAPSLPDNVIQNTLKKYQEVLRLLSD